jgi:type IV pilus assembly protein PilM
MKTVGVDIAAGAVRVAVIDGLDSRGLAIVSRIGMVPYREGVVEQGRIKNKVVVAQALIAALRQAKAPRYGFVLGYAAPEVAVTRIPMHSVIKPEERVRTIRTSGTAIAPALLLADSIIDTNFVSTATNAEGQSFDTLVVAAALKSEVAELVSLMELARCEPRAIDLSAAALMRALVRTPVNSTDVHTVIDIGATKTTIVTRQGPHLLSVRVIPMGGANVTRAIMAATDDTFDQAEKRKMFLRLANSGESGPVALPSSYGAVEAEILDENPESRLDESVNNVVADLIEQIAGSIENDAGGYGSAFTQGVVLSGLTAQIPGLKERIYQRLGVPVQLGRPWATIEVSKANAQYIVGGPDNPRPLLDLTTAIGLALWRKEGSA